MDPVIVQDINSYGGIKRDTKGDGQCFKYSFTDTAVDAGCDPFLVSCAGTVVPGGNTRGSWQGMIMLSKEMHEWIRRNYVELTRPDVRYFVKPRRQKVSSRRTGFNAGPFKIEVLTTPDPSKPPSTKEFFDYHDDRHVISILDYAINSIYIQPSIL